MVLCLLKEGGFAQKTDKGMQFVYPNGEMMNFNFKDKIVIHKDADGKETKLSGKKAIEFCFQVSQSGKDNPQFNELSKIFEQSQPGKIYNSYHSYVLWQ